MLRLIIREGCFIVAVVAILALAGVVPWWMGVISVTVIWLLITLKRRLPARAAGWTVLNANSLKIGQYTFPLIKFKQGDVLLFDGIELKRNAVTGAVTCSLVSIGGADKGSSTESDLEFIKESLTSLCAKAPQFKKCFAGKEITALVDPPTRIELDA